jgi:TonB family protein
MNRFQKKCIIASTGLHLLLVIILFVGPAFLSSSSKTMDVPLLDFVPVKTVDELVSGGGSRNGGSPPPPVLPQSDPVKPPEPVKAPDPVPPKPDPLPKDIPKPKDDSQSPELTDKPKPKKVEVSIKLVTRKPTATNTNTRADQEAKDQADARRRATEQMAKAVDRISQGLSPGVGINPRDFYGPGTGGVPYANFLQAVKKVYWDAWIVPDGINDDSATTSVSVTIAKDGHVISASIVRRSGNAAADHSVQMAIDRVKFVAPLPEDSKDTQRTVTIDFNVKAKLLG